MSINSFMHKIADDPAGESEKETNWNDPIPFDDYSLLPEFPVDVLPGMGKKFISELAEITQVDPGLPGCLYLAALSACLGGRVAVVNYTELPVSFRLTGIAGMAHRLTQLDTMDGARLASDGGTLRLPPHAVLVVE